MGSDSIPPSDAALPAAAAAALALVPVREPEAAPVLDPMLEPVFELVLEVEPEGERAPTLLLLLEVVALGIAPLAVASREPLEAVL